MFGIKVRYYTRDKSSRKVHDLSMKDNTLDALRQPLLWHYGWSSRTFQHLPCHTGMLAKTFPESILRVLEGKKKSFKIEKSTDDPSTLDMMAPP